MNAKDVACRIVKNNNVKIQSDLIENGILFDDDLDEYFGREVTREIASTIEKEFKLDLDEVSVLRSMYEVKGEWVGAFWLSNFSGANYLKDLIVTHYE